MCANIGYFFESAFLEFVFLIFYFNCELFELILIAWEGAFTEQDINILFMENIISHFTIHFFGLEVDGLVVSIAMHVFE